MYRCCNCGGVFETPRKVFERYPDWGGQWFFACPECFMADDFKEVNEWQENG